MSSKRAMKQAQKQAYARHRSNITNNRFGKMKRNTSRESVILFNETVRQYVTAEKIEHFFEVTQTINTLINNQKIFNTNNQTRQ